MWPALKNMLIEELRTVKMGGVDDFRNFINAVIDANAYKTIKGYIDFAAASSDAEIIAGGKCDDTEGYFIEPTVIETGNPQFKTMGGPETEVGRLKSGDFCGEMAFLLRTPRFATVRTVSECELFKFRSGDFERLLQKSPHLAGMLRQTVSRRFGEIFSADK